MITKVQKWGNSQGLRLSKQLLEDAHIRIGDEVNVAVQDSVIVIRSARPFRGKHTLVELVAGLPKNYKDEELDWGKPVGREAW